MGALRMLRAIVIALLVALLPSHARAQERIALLIGNQGYFADGIVEDIITAR